MKTHTKCGIKIFEIDIKYKLYTKCGIKIFEIDIKYKLYFLFTYSTLVESPYHVVLEELRMHVSSIVFAQKPL